MAGFLLAHNAGLDDKGKQIIAFQTEIVGSKERCLCLFQIEEGE
jgi:hypothetical protein